MRMIYVLLTLFMAAEIYGCNRENESEIKPSEDVTIEREEEYDREDINNQKNVPVETEKVLKIDKE